MRKELVALRSAMSNCGIDVYVIPTDDFHGSEYVGDYFKCRTYVSGFTGSAGTLVVTQSWAGLWTDGRYFLQAAQQLQGSGIDLMKMNEPGVPTLQDWIAQHLSAGQALGFDGRCITCDTGLLFEKTAHKNGASICYECDLVGEIWTNRPAMSSAPVWELDSCYTGCSRSEKLQALRRAIQLAGADFHVLTSLDDIAWLLNIRGDDVACCPVVLSYLIIAADRAILYVDESKFSPELRAALEADGITLLPYLQFYQDLMTLPATGTVLADTSRLNYTTARRIPSGLQLLAQKNPTTVQKAVKNPIEVENMRIAHIRDGVALTRFMKWLQDHVGQEPLTEISVSEVLEHFREAQENYLGPSFSPIVGYADHGAIIHYGATPETDAPLKPEGLLLADTGGHYLEGTTDVTRTFVLGPLTEAMKHDYTLVLRSHLALLNSIIKKGCNGAALDFAARKPFWDEGKDYNHGTGHGVGYLLSVHEGPQQIKYAAGSSAPLEPGMITSDEPGIYLAGRYGIRLESLMVCVPCRENEYGSFYRFEALTMCPFELDAINVDELNPRERDQLNAYHKLVFDSISPFFSGEEYTWLRHVTRPV